MGQVSNQLTPWQMCWTKLVPLYKHNSNGYQEPCPHQNHQRQVEPTVPWITPGLRRLMRNELPETIIEAERQHRGLQACLEGPGQAPLSIWTFFNVYIASRNSLHCFLAHIAQAQHISAEDGLYFPLQIRHLNLDLVPLPSGVEVYRHIKLLGSLSSSVFERRASTGSGLFASLGSGLVEILG